MATRTKIEDFLDTITSRPAIITGPGITSHSGVYEDIIDTLEKTGLLDHDSWCSTKTFFEILDSSREVPNFDMGYFEETLRNAARNLQKSHYVENIVQSNWSAIISVTPDLSIDEAIRLKFDALPTSRSVSVLDDPNILPEIRSLPIYKLLGNANSYSSQTSIPKGSAEFEIRKHSWPRLLSTFSDFVRNAPVLVLGNESNHKILEACLAALFSLPPPHPSRFVFIEGDSVLENVTIKGLLESRNVISVSSSIDQLLIAVAEKTGQPMQIKLDLDVQPTSLGDKATEFAKKYINTLSIVPYRKISTTEIRQKHNQLLDALFRPTSLDWDPFFANINIRRTVSQKIIDNIEIGISNNPHRPSIHVIRGEAGTGKTCVLKEISVNLVSNGWICLWVNCGIVTRSSDELRSALKELSALYHENENEPKIAILCDNGMTARVHPMDIISELQRHEVPCAILVSYRSTELISDTGISYAAGMIPESETELEVELDEDELKQLPNFLMEAGVAKDREEARNYLDYLDTRNASDILCVLWFLVPSTRGSLSAALEDEYLSLGRTRENIRALAQGSESMSLAAKAAWEFCAVCSDLRLGIPTEILVRAMGISWDDWIMLCEHGKPLWGLLYPEEHQATGEASYWTRNDVVTRVLTRIINGGHGHAGEIPILKKLISACSIGTDVYRDFIMELLVSRRKFLGDRYTLEQGIELFEFAFSALPYPDKTLRHQYGLWLKDKDADLADALKELNLALETPDYPGAQSAERPEHIHTSLAATVVQQAGKGERSLDSALNDVQEHLRHAQAFALFDPHASHVFSRLLLELAQMHAAEGDPGGHVSAVSEALAVIEKTIQLIGTKLSTKGSFSKDIEMFGHLQDRLLGTFEDLDSLHELAHRIFDDSGSQAGFAVAGRRMLLAANTSGKRKDYNKVKEFIDSCINKLEQSGRSLSARMRALKVDLYIRWQIHKYGGAVDWMLLKEELEYLIKDPLFKDNIVQMFYYAVTLFHLDRQSDANVIFTRLRKIGISGNIKGAGRCYYLGKEGFPRQMQGVARKSHDRWYVEINELGNDLHLRNVNPGLVNGKSIRCYVGFSFFGPFATLERPEERDFELSS